MNSFAPRTESAAKADLAQMLRYKRPADSKTHWEFLARFLGELPNAYTDAEGNIICQIDSPRILWSCHTDSVHRQAGFQKVYEGKAKNGRMYFALRKKSHDCLGADDAAGVWLMREMIHYRVPGLYIFHNAEEIGGIGSQFIARNTPELLSESECAIALDRKARHSVITHQFDRCCSDVFGESLAAILNAGSGFDYRLDDTGLFTDTANYVDHIGECTNLSVGYDNEHTSSEVLDIAHILEMRDALCAFDGSTLEYSRQPGEVDPAEMSAWKRGFYSWDEDPNNPRGSIDEQDAAGDMRFADLLDLVQAHPYAAARLLDDYGLDDESMIDAVYEYEREIVWPKRGVAQ